jgi:lysophospholipase L1-like esterase
MSGGRIPLHDITKNNTEEAMKYMIKFVNENKDKNIVLINSPQMHDLIPTSCVNKEVLNYNTQLRKVPRLQPNVKLLEIKLGRNHFTRHGLHLNPKGKKLIFQEIAMIVD